MASTNRRERRVHRIGCSQVLGVFDWRVVEGQQHAPILGETFARGVVFGLILFQEAVERLVGDVTCSSLPELV